MAGYTFQYCVYGHPKRKPSEGNFLGYVQDFCSLYAREQAKKIFTGFTITSVIKDRQAFANPNH